jgi:hypothetical protein
LMLLRWVESWKPSPVGARLPLCHPHHRVSSLGEVRVVERFAQGLHDVVPEVVAALSARGAAHRRLLLEEVRVRGRESVRLLVARAGRPPRSQGGASPLADPEDLLHRREGLLDRAGLRVGGDPNLQRRFLPVRARFGCKGLVVGWKSVLRCLVGWRFTLMGWLSSFTRTFGGVFRGGIFSARFSKEGLKE